MSNKRTLAWTSDKETWAPTLFAVGVQVCLVAFTPHLVAAIVGPLLIVTAILLGTSRRLGWPLDRRTRRQANSQPDPRRQLLRDRIGALASQCKLATFVAYGLEGASERQRGFAIFSKWDQETRAFISEALGDDEAHWYQFGRDNESTSQETSTLARFYDTRVQRLRDLLSRLDSLEIRDDWRP